MNFPTAIHQGWKYGGRLSSKNRYLYKATDDTEEKILEYIISELNLGYNTKHVKTQIKLYVQENLEDLRTLTCKYLAVKGITLEQHLEKFLTCTNYADELTLVLMSQRYVVNIAVLTSGDGYWSMTWFAILEECKLVFLGMEHKSKALAFLPTKWCIQNRKPVIPLSPELKEQCIFPKLWKNL